MNATITADSFVAITMNTDDIDLTVNFEDFYRNSFPGLVAVATALTGTVQSGEDLVQDTMVKAFIRWNRVRRLEHPRGWAHRVLLNACTGWWRRRKTEERYIARLRRAEPSVSGPSPEAMAFWQAVRQLPERHRQVIALHYAGDHSVAEVASILTIPEGTVRSDLTRARQALAHLLGD